MAYYEVISLMHQQATSFGLPSAEVGLQGIDPERDLLSAIRSAAPVFRNDA